MILIVTGSRNWPSSQQVWQTLDRLNPSMVCVGCCPSGADLHARAWCRNRRVRLETFAADWSKGKGAGPVRNRTLVLWSLGYAKTYNVPLRAVGFYDGGPGTTDCLQRIANAGIAYDVVFGDVSDEARRELLERLGTDQCGLFG